jgi:hypothetical protein
MAITDDARATADAAAMLNDGCVLTTLHETGNGDRESLTRPLHPLLARRGLTPPYEQLVIGALKLLVESGMAIQRRPRVDPYDPSAYQIEYAKIQTPAAPDAHAAGGESTVSFLAMCRVAAALSLAVESAHAYSSFGELVHQPLTGGALILVFVFAELGQLLRVVACRLREWWRSR